MPVRMRRKLRGKDGGKHPHAKNAQDFAVQTTPNPQLCRANARTCYNVLSAHVGKLDNDEMERRLAAALVALGRVMGES